MCDLFAPHTSGDLCLLCMRPQNARRRPELEEAVQRARNTALRLRWAAKVSPGAAPARRNEPPSHKRHTAVTRSHDRCIAPPPRGRHGYCWRRAEEVQTRQFATHMAAGRRYVSDGRGWQVVEVGVKCRVDS